MFNEPMSPPRRDSTAPAPASPTTDALTGPGSGPPGLSPGKRAAPAGVTSRRTLNREAPAPRVPTKAQQAVDKLLDQIRTRADQTPPAAKEETRGDEKRDADGHFAKGTKPGPGRPPGSRNKIPKSLKEVVRALGDGVIDVRFIDLVTDTLVERPVAYLLADQLVTGLNDPKHSAAFVKLILELDLRWPTTQTEVDAVHARQTPKMVFLNQPPPDGQARRPTEATPDPAQIADPNGKILDAMTDKVVMRAPQQSVPEDDGLGAGEDRLELADDPPSLCLACSGSGRQRIGFGDRVKPCDECAGAGRLQ